MQVKVGVADCQETNTLHSGSPLLLVGHRDLHIAAETEQLVLLEVAVRVCVCVCVCVCVRRVKSSVNMWEGEA